jgi:hypothetical protein
LLLYDVFFWRIIHLDSNLIFSHINFIFLDWVSNNYQLFLRLCLQKGFNIFIGNLKLLHLDRFFPVSFDLALINTHLFFDRAIKLLFCQYGFRIFYIELVVSQFYWKLSPYIGFYGLNCLFRLNRNISLFLIIQRLICLCFWLCYLYSAVLNLSLIIHLGKLMFMCIDECIWAWLYIFAVLFSFLFSFDKVIDLLILFITYTTVATSWLCITTIIALVGILFDFKSYFIVQFLFKGKESINDSCSHLGIICNLILVDSIIFNIA